MRISGTLLFAFAVAAFGAPALADPLGESGSAKLAAYQVCRPVAAIDMAAAGSSAFTECNGIVKNLEAQTQPDNLAIRCLESSNNRPEGYTYSGACTLTDHDGDKLYMTYDGSKSGEVKWAGGTGKYEGVSGSGGLSVDVAPRSGGDLFAYTLKLEVNWTRKGK